MRESAFCGWLLLDPEEDPRIDNIITRCCGSMLCTKECQVFTGRSPPLSASRNVDTEEPGHWKLLVIQPHSGHTVPLQPE